MNVVAIRMGYDIDSDNPFPDKHTYLDPNEFANVYSNRLCACNCVNNSKNRIETLKNKMKEFSH